MHSSFGLLFIAYFQLPVYVNLGVLHVKWLAGFWVEPWCVTTFSNCCVEPSRTGVSTGVSDLN